MFGSLKYSSLRPHRCSIQLWLNAVIPRIYQRQKHDLLRSEVCLTVRDAQIDASIFAKPVVVHDTVDSNGLGAKCQILKFDLADTNLIVEKHVVVHDLAGQDQVVDALRIRDLPGESLVIIRVKFVLLLGRFLITIVLVEDYILKSRGMM